MWKISEDGRIDRLVVYVTVDGQPVPVGAITVEGKGAVRQSRFAYARSWLGDGFPISPILPLRAKATVSAPYELPLAFYDAAPDGWGRSILTAAFARQVFGMAEFLAAAGDDRTGELRFGPTPESGPMQWVPHDDPLFALPDGSESLQELLEAAEAVDAGEATVTHLRKLFRSSADTGGARPKARLRIDGEEWIAKFRTWGDAFDDPKIETVCLDLADKCGIDVPPHRLVDVAGRSVLLVQRFDREGDSRLGYMSAGTLVQAAPSTYQTNVTYADVAAKARRSGIEPCEEAVFRRMLFNAFIHNTDDHLRNHGFRRIDGKWTLSPAFDLVPCNRPSHVLAPVRGVPAIPDPAAMLDTCAAFGLDRDKAVEIYSDIVDGLAALPELLDRHEVSAKDRGTVAGLMSLAFNPPAIKNAVL
ncbi:MAG: type II toxin-antitoxin system HipA family toxin [Alphaproteobacteria bacterium]|nr:type II toxin-antitoxin system HipA family toxin [Alphaproteobacteria bacterium]